MNHSQFLKLCRSTSTALGCIDIDALGITNSIDVDGVNMALFFDEDFAPDHILCYIDIGPLPPFRREEILERILAINLLTATKTSGVYGLDQARDSLVFVQHFASPELLSGEVLAEILKGYSTHVSSLKQNLLDPDNLRPVPNILAESLGDHVQNLA
jgi:hypothetical protein